jgi:hypothetical protein
MTCWIDHHFITADSQASSTGVPSGPFTFDCNSSKFNAGRSYLTASGVNGRSASVKPVTVVLQRLSNKSYQLAATSLYSTGIEYTKSLEWTNKGLLPLSWNGKAATVPVDTPVMHKRFLDELRLWASNAGRGFVDQTDSSFVWDNACTKEVSVNVNRQSDNAPLHLDVHGPIEILRPIFPDDSLILAGGCKLTDGAGFFNSIRGASMTTMNQVLNTLFTAGYRLKSYSIDHPCITKDSVAPLI